MRPGEIPALGGWDIWRLREIGGWGDSGRILGARWEQVGGPALLDAEPSRVVPLWEDAALGRWLGTLGVQNPDALLVESNRDGGVTLRPIDLKWSLDTADYAQISGETLRRLFERAGTRLSAMVGVAESPRFGDGLFAVPECRLNRVFLASAENLRREYPIQARETRWLDFDRCAFFSSLPGWLIAVRLAELEGVVDVCGDPDLATRYFHLGAGVRGALLAEECSLFAEPGEVGDVLAIDPDVEQDVARRFDALVARSGARDARDVVQRLSGAQSDRQARRVQLRALLKPPYRFAEFLASAAKLDRAPAVDDEAALLPLRRHFGEVGRAHAAAVRERGRALVAAGLSEQAALDQIRDEDDAFRQRAREAGLRAVASISVGAGTD